MPNRGNAEKKPTLLDVARAAGVSRTTASNAFNRPDQLSATLRRHVLATAQRLGYAGPDPRARLLRTGHVGAIGMVFADSLTYAVSDPAAIAMLQGIAQTCTRHRAGLLLLPVSSDPETLTTLSTAVVDGFLIHCLAGGSPAIGVLRECGLPLVAIDFDGLDDWPTVLVDDFAGAYDAARHLVELGHRRFAIMSLDMAPEPYRGRVDANRLQAASYIVTRKRLEGYLKALAEAGVAEGDIAIFEDCENTPDSTQDLARRYLAGPGRPTAVLAMSDQMALGVLSAALDLGIAVPQGLSVVGFDDVAHTAHTSPPLTTVRQPLAEKGRRAAELLLEGANGPHRIMLEPELVVRGSTAPPSGKKGRP